MKYAIAALVAAVLVVASIWPADAGPLDRCACNQKEMERCRETIKKCEALDKRLTKVENEMLAVQSWAKSLTDYLSSGGK